MLSSLSQPHPRSELSLRGLSPQHLLQASPEQRRQALKERALKLAAERKEVLAEETAHLRDRQFAENCDPLRAKQSQLAAKQAVLDQQAQVCW